MEKSNDKGFLGDPLLALLILGGHRELLASPGRSTVAGLRLLSFLKATEYFVGEQLVRAS